MSTLTLCLPTTADEADVRALNSSCSTDTFDFLAGVGTLGDYAAFLDSVRNQHEGTNLPDGWLPADFLLAEITTDDGGTALIGRSSIRYGLTEHLLNYDGHIGYAVAPNHRRRGYATEILRQSLALLAERGIGKALITCDDDNAGSIGVIEANGGVLDDRRTNPDGTLIRRYWIELQPEPVTR
ncbi:GNAT family N-acetyltransferase [Corynebacterium variabile]|uniref:GNAT family N-acetyltransferase n=1 Tax=Corynebacterium variabile TaxID=1727 RepID=UPI003A9136FC